VKSINDLASIFKDLSVLVIEQGTILDRIDYNVQEAKDNVEGAVKELTEVQQRESSTRAKSCIMC
jgi:syntaxin 16